MEKFLNAIKETITPNNILKSIEYAEEIKNPLLKEIYIDNLEHSIKLIKKIIAQNVRKTQ